MEIVMTMVLDLPAPTAVEQAEASPSGPEPGTREVRYRYSTNLAPLLQHLGVSLLVSTYQAGKVVLVGEHQGGLALSFHNFEQAMGMAVGPDRIAVAARDRVWFLRAAPDLGPRIEPAGRYDGCYLARSALLTGDIHAHEAAWAGGELWVVNTLFSCLCTLHEGFSFVPRWRPPFITALAAEERCHLNGLAVAEGQPVYATALAETDTPAGWRTHKEKTGCLLHIPSGQTVARGFAMPHSPRVYGGRVWLLHSGAGQLVTVDPQAETVETVAELPGYTRGLAFHDAFAFVGLSRIRETAVFGGVPIAARREQLKCGLAVVDVRAGRAVAHLEFTAGVDEIFDVQVLPGLRRPALAGPFAAVEGGQTIWHVPGESRGPAGGPMPGAEASVPGKEVPDT
jgi:uncharacterized protein (TIGR03032 family)